MNIKQAKQEIINTVQAYLTKDETGDPRRASASGASDRTTWNRKDGNHGAGRKRM